MRVNWKQWKTSWATVSPSAFALPCWAMGEMRTRQEAIGPVTPPSASTGSASPFSRVPAPSVSSSAVVYTSMSGAGMPMRAVKNAA